MLILKQNSANSVPTPPAGKGTIFLDDSDTLSVKTSDGNVETFPTVAASNAQVVFINGTALSGEAAFTYDFNNNVLNISGNVAAGNVKTDNLLYANGVPWDLSDPGGSNTQIQFNDDESFGGSAAFTFNKSTNTVSIGNALSVTGNASAGNVNAGNLLTANFVTGTLTTASQPNITSVGTLTDLNVSGNTIIGGNLTVNGNLVYVNVETVAVEDPIIQLQTGPNGAAPSSNSGKDIGSALNYYNSQARVAFMGWDVSNAEFGLASEASITNEVVTFSTYGNLRAGVYFGNGSGLSALTGANVTGTVANATHASTANTVVDAAQPNITSVGTLTSLAVTGNANVGNIGGAAGVFTANVSAGNLSTGGTLNVTGNANVVNLGASGTVTVTGNASAGNLSTGGTLSVTGNGNLGNVGAAAGVFTSNVTAGNVNTAGKVVASTLESNVTTGTAPFTVASTTKVTNLNADLLDGYSTDTAATANTVVIRDANGSFSANVVTASLSGAATTAGTVTTAAQPNITSVGTLSSLTVTGNVSAGNVSGTLLTGTLATAAQPNITSVGTLSSLTASGNVTGGNLVTAGKVYASEMLNGGTGIYLSAGPSGYINFFTTSGDKASISDTGNIIASNVIANSTVFATTANISGNVNAGNVGATNGVFTNVSGNGAALTALPGGNVTGQVANALVSGTVYTAAQPNITSVGTLTGLGVNGNITAANITANTGVFTGNGIGLSALAGANVTGQVGNALVAGTVYTNAQPNITSVGTLSSLAVTGNGTFGNVYANSGTVGAANLTGTLTTNAQPNITSVGTLTSVTITGNVAAGNLTTTGVLSVTGTGVSSIAGNLDMTSNNIINLASPTSANDAATKQYVDDLASTALIYHEGVTAATTDTLATTTGGTITYNNGASGVGANLVTTGSFNLIDTANVQTVGIRILVKNEANAAHNGIYTWANATTIVRSTDADEYGVGAGSLSLNDYFFVSGGSVNKGSAYVLDAPSGTITFGTSNIQFAQFSSSQVYSNGTGLGLSGTVFSVNASQTQVTALGTVTTGTWNSLVGSSATFAAGLSGANLASITGANVTGTVPAATVAGTVTTAAQPNITSVGTLTGLGVNGTVTAVNITANTGVFTGNGSGLSAIAGANVTGTVSSATTAGTVTTAAQPNITSVGTLSSLSSSGNITAPNLIANTGMFISSVNAAVSAAGTVQGNATALTTQINVVSTVASGAGVRLPTAVAGMRVTIMNTAANALAVYPATSGIINSAAANAAFSQAAGSRLDFVAVSTTQWYTLNATYA